MGRGDAASKYAHSGKPKGSLTQKAAGDVTATGRGDVSPGGVNDRGTFEEDGPVTWEAPVCPRPQAGFAEAPDQMPPTRQAFADARRAGTQQAFAPW